MPDPKLQLLTPHNSQLIFIDKESNVPRPRPRSPCLCPFRHWVGALGPRQ